MNPESAFVIDIAGDVVERQELLNRTQIVTLEGTGDGWTFVGICRGNLGPKAVLPKAT